MATEVKLPELGDGIESGDVLEIFVSVGDVITAGQDVVEMETDKATVPVPSSLGGKVTKILVAEGDTVAIGGGLLEVEAAEGAAAPAAPEAPKEPAAKAPEPPAPQPSAPATPVAKTPEPAPAAPAPAAPAPVTPAPAATPAPVAPPAPEPAAPLASASSGNIAAGPAIRRFAREVGVDLANVTGSADGGRITRDDVLAVVRSASKSAAAAPAASAASPGAASSSQPLPGTADADDFGPISVERMSKIRKTISRQMHASWSTVPRVTNFDDADITNLEQLRQSSKDDYAAQGLKLTTMPFLIKAVATALRHHPSMNAIIDEQNEQIIYKNYVNVGIAVDTDRGLVVPVMKNADRMAVPEVTRSLAEMAGKVRGGNFGVNDLKGGSFTISNLGAIGGQYSTPIVNVPEVAILLVGRSRKLPVVMPDDSIKPRLMMPLSLSYDHRLVDGGTAARFLNDVIGYLEAPSRLLLAL
ncbi:Dihydrolipoyllysine-residue acetyltransferase component of pyruvate dehydrogenase complex [Rubripirellula amarantea]|uniref:Dihydrolipoamide acetyltransferase component of pyruvate dehydrogenase complex n=1 Tax=Rubripirellula amarantea TaxID=2527999 RepID=A0A5C5WPM8_9BACT|nr:2-oxo acid dehydrogenase subunit E2 [Rubripirellula amarantea]TWT52814.1 Dihydrolipoyllysine-residue acetyltransferase component of pyruvate dehydrogenase complex [Rubripirellula amarantea]